MESANHELQPSRSELRNFGLLLGALFALIFGALPLIRGRATPLWPWVVAALLWAGAMLAPASLRLLHRGWTRLGLALGWVNTRVILSLLFALSIIPVGLLMRLLGRDRMGRKFDPALESYRIAANPRANSSMERPF
ncbi:MAG: SxtJ family membrane protein [Candidatus Binataceae bacterium]